MTLINKELLDALDKFDNEYLDRTTDVEKKINYWKNVISNAQNSKRSDSEKEIIQILIEREIRKLKQFDPE